MFELKGIEKTGVYIMRRTFEDFLLAGYVEKRFVYVRKRSNAVHSLRVFIYETRYIYAVFGHLR